MKKVAIFNLALFTFVMSCSAQKTEERQISAFNKIKASGTVRIVYTSSDSLILRVTAASDEINNVFVKVDNEVLVVENKGNFSQPVTVHIKNNQALLALEAGGTSSFINKNQIMGNELTLSLTGAANAEINAETSALNCQLSGASNLKLNGKTESLNVNATGASNFRGYSLVAVNATVVTSGAAIAKINASEKVKANASGASSVKIKGEPKEVNAEASPAASVSRSANKNTTASDGDTVRFTWSGKKILVINLEDDDKDTGKKKHESKGDDIDDFKHWHGFSMGINGYYNATGGLNIPKTYGYMDLNYSRSLNYQLNIIERHFNIAKNYFKVVTGLGFDFHVYALSNKTNLNADSSFTWGTIDSTNTYSYTKNRLRSTYLQVPLLLEFNTSKNPDRSFHMAAGVIGQYLIASKTKQVLESNRTDITRIRKDSYNLSPFVLKAHVNAGYAGWTLFAEYNLTPLFEPGKGPELYPFTAGIRIVPFS